MEKSEFDIVIGRSSNGEMFRMSISHLPHLFLLYSDPDQLIHFLNKAVQQWEGHLISQEIELALAMSEKHLQFVFQNDLSLISSYRVYNKTNPEQGSIASRYYFMQYLMKELKKRTKRTHAHKNKPLIIITDDIFELVITKRKYTGLYFLHLLIEGPAYGIHFFAASIRVYRNLMNQLMAMNPVLMTAMKQMVPDLKLDMNQPLGSELIITPENLYFFKTRQQMDYDRYFPAD